MSTLTEGPPATPLPGVRSQLNLARWAVAPLVLLSVGLLAAGNGGFFPPAWGWSAVALLWAAGIALIVTEPMRLRRVEWITLGSFTGLGTWMLMSQLWQGGATQPVQEAERMLVYVAGLAACMLLTRRADLRPLLTGLLL